MSGEIRIRKRKRRTLNFKDLLKTMKGWNKYGIVSGKRSKKRKGKRSKEIIYRNKQRERNTWTYWIESIRVLLLL